MTMVRWPCLRDLSLSGCKKLNGLPVIALAKGPLASLRSLSLEHLPLIKADSVVQIIRNLPQLTAFRKGMLNDRAVSELCSLLPRLEVLKIGNSKKANGAITDKGIQAISGLRYLRSLDVTGLHRCTQVALVVSELPYLSHLDLRGCSDDGEPGCSNADVLAVALQQQSKLMPNLRCVSLTTSGGHGGEHIPAWGCRKEVEVTIEPKDDYLWK